MKSLPLLSSLPYLAQISAILTVLIVVFEPQPNHHCARAFSPPTNSRFRPAALDNNNYCQLQSWQYSCRMTTRRAPIISKTRSSTNNNKSRCIIQLNSNSDNAVNDDGANQINDSNANLYEPHIVILGGGFGGINTALTLPTLPWTNNNISSSNSNSSNGNSKTTNKGGGSIIRPKITLIDKSERFVFLPLLYELCVEDASLEEVAPTFKSLLEGSGTGKGNRSGRSGSGGLAALSGGLPDLTNLIGSLQIQSDEKDEEQSAIIEDVQFLQAQVEGIDANNQQVVISNCNTNSIETIDYDALVIATGGEISLDAIPGAAEYALPFYTVEQCLELKRRLSLFDNYYYLDEKSSDSNVEEATHESVVVVGGGYSGVELALNLVDRLNSGGSSNKNQRVQVTLVHRGKQVLEYATEYNHNSGLERLKAAGVNVMTSTSVEEVLPWEEKERGGRGSGSLNALTKNKCIVKVSSSFNNDDDDDENDSSTLLPATLLLWTAGATPTSKQNTGIRNSILPRDVMGRIVTSPTLNVKEYPNVFAVGDCSRPKKVPYPATAQVAIQQATVAAFNIYATLTNEQMDDTKRTTMSKNKVELLPFNYINLGEMMTLGTNDATISTLGGRIELGGPAASWLRRWIYAVRMPTLKQGLIAAVDGTERKLARNLVGGSGSKDGGEKRRSKPVEWK